MKVDQVTYLVIFLVRPLLISSSIQCGRVIYRLLFFKKYLIPIFCIALMSKIIKNLYQVNSFPAQEAIYKLVHNLLNDNFVA